MRFWIAKIGLVFLPLLLLACAPQEAPSIQFVVPNGYRGWLTIYQDKEKGVAFARSMRIEFSSNGKMRVKDVSPLYDWYKPIASFKNGSRIPLAVEDPPPDSVAFWSVGSRPDKSVRFFIGSKADYDAAP